MLGTGWIAHEMGEALKRVNGEIYACCATSMESAKKYAEEFDVKNAYGSADEMLADKNIDIVYIATPFHNVILSLSAVFIPVNSRHSTQEASFLLRNSYCL